MGVIMAAELISVILTTFNRPDALNASLRALAHQTDRNFEVVVADDGSDQRTAQVIHEWALRPLMAVKHVRQEHKGFRGGEIRNRAIAASSGRYCIFLDGDCLARADFVETASPPRQSGMVYRRQSDFVVSGTNRDCARGRCSGGSLGFRPAHAGVDARRCQSAATGNSPATRAAAQAPSSRLGGSKDLQFGGCAHRPRSGRRIRHTLRRLGPGRFRSRRAAVPRRDQT